MSYQYAILMETSGREFESWYNFIRYEGNEEELLHLQKQLSKVEFYILGELSTFDLELEHLVSEDTARQMCMVDLNAYMFHRKFDGKLEKIDFGFSRRDDNEDKIEKVYDKIGNGDIDKYVDGEEDFSDENEIVDDDSKEESSPSSRNPSPSSKSPSNPSPKKKISRSPRRVSRSPRKKDLDSKKKK
jgi:hypothetical protein